MNEVLSQRAKTHKITIAVLAKGVEMLYNNFTALKCESIRRRCEHGTDLSSQRRLPVSEPDSEKRSDRACREIRAAQEALVSELQSGDTILKLKTRLDRLHGEEAKQ